MSCSVPVRASCPQPQNSATPKKHKPVATSEAKGAPMRHLAQHSSKPREKSDEVGWDGRDGECSEPAAQEQTSTAGGGKQLEGKPRSGCLCCWRAQEQLHQELSKQWCRIAPKQGQGDSSTGAVQHLLGMRWTRS